MTSQLHINVAPRGITMSWAIVGSTLLSFVAKGEISNSRLDELIADCGKRKLQFGIGTGLGRAQFDSVQRKRTSDVFKALTRTVMVQDDVIVRGIVTALGWLGMSIKSYGWKQLDDAIAYVNSPDASPQEIKTLILKLRDDGLRAIGEDPSNL